MSQNNNKSGKPEKKQWMRIAVLVVACVMFLGIIILPFI